jgi:hypothetical protein
MRIIRVSAAAHMQRRHRRSAAVRDLTVTNDMKGRAANGRGQARVWPIGGGTLFEGATALTQMGLESGSRWSGLWGWGATLRASKMEPTVAQGCQR